MKKIAVLLIGEIKYDGRVLKEIATLKRWGHEVELIVSRFTSDDIKDYDFKIYNLNLLKKKNPVQNILSIFIFCRRAYKILNKIKPDIVHCNDLSTLYAGCLYKKHYKRSKIIYDAHELYPESQNEWKRTLFWNLVERRYIKTADQVICPEMNRAAYLKDKYRIDKINIIENYPQRVKLVEVNYIEKDIPLSIRKKKILYLGLISNGRCIEEIISAFSHLPEQYVLILIGKVDPPQYMHDMENLIGQHGLEGRVFIRKPVENRLVINYINSADIGIFFYKNNNLNNYFCASNKLYEFINCGKPVITNDYPGLKEVVEKNKIGACLKEINETAISDTVLCLEYMDIGAFNTDEFFWDNLEGRFIKIYA